MIYIFDIDGTLADCSHRLGFISGDNKDWDSFYSACADDKPIDEVLEVLNLMAECAGIRIWVFTGRSDVVQKETEEWLLDNSNLGLFKLKMRKHGDYRPDYEIKREWLNQLAPKDSEARAQIAGVFEDRDSVCKMWREEGLRCFQVAEGKF